MTSLNISLQQMFWAKKTCDGNSVHVRGWATVHGAPFQADGLADRILSIVAGRGDIDLRSLGKEVDTWNGSFSFVLVTPNGVVLCADRIRSYPLLYSQSPDGNIAITDQFDSIPRNPGLHRPFASDRIEEYLVSGFIYGNGTLRPDVLGMQPGELVKLQGGNIESHRYFLYCPAESEDLLDPEDLARRIVQEQDAAICRMVASAPDVNRWVVPLSGGHDSRTVLIHLHRQKVKNVICFSYGKKDNWESRVSRSVAEALGYPWHYVEYTPASWKDMFDMPSNRIDEFVRNASNGVSQPIFQDIPALSHLHRHGILSANDIVVPGHSYDFLTGDYFDIAWNKVSRNELILHIMDRYAELWGINRWRTAGNAGIPERVHAIVNGFGYPSTVSNIAMLATFAWQENQGKFIVNCVRAIEHFAYRWRLPLWDYRLIDLWMQVPVQLQYKRRFFYDVYVRYMEPAELSSLRLSDQRTNKYWRIKKALMSLLPEPLMRLLWETQFGDLHYVKNFLLGRGKVLQDILGNGPILCERWQEVFNRHLAPHAQCPLVPWQKHPDGLIAAYSLMQSGAHHPE